MTTASFNHPVLLVEDRDIEAAYRLGANSYIVKPVNFEKFLEVAEQIELYWCVTNQPPH